MAYFPIVGRLDCGSSSREHQGFWEMHGYGVMTIYRSDWDRFGGKSTQNNFRTNTTSPFTIFVFIFSGQGSDVTCMRLLAIHHFNFFFRKSLDAYLVTRIVS